jgi:hypothetical protein
MPELNGRELLSEWRRVMDSMVGNATSAAGRSQLPAELLRASRRQLELLQTIVESEQRVQGSLLGGILAPLDGFFDLLEETGSTLRRQAEALDAAGRAMQETAALLKTQAELFERGVKTIRQPTVLARAAASAGLSASTGRRPGSAPGARASAAPARPAAKRAARASKPAAPAAKRPAAARAEGAGAKTTATGTTGKAAGDGKARS